MLKHLDFRHLGCMLPIAGTLPAPGNRVLHAKHFTKCTERLVDFAFVDLELNKVSIPVAVGNTKSRAIPDRLGFQIEGTSRQAEWLYDHYVDHVMYAMLHSDWNDPIKP